MARRPVGSRPARLLYALCALALGAGAVGLDVATARGQVPQPYVPNVDQRSGMLTRFTPTPARLPEDADRDSFQSTRYQDEHDNFHWKLHPRNSWKDGGMYGRGFCPDCTAAIYPFFPGSPGNKIGPECYNNTHPAVGRWVGNLVHPFKPVGMYYDRGVYAPVYDLDWTVPGPGPFPWPHFFKRPTGG